MLETTISTVDSTSTLTSALNPSNTVGRYPTNFETDLMFALGDKLMPVIEKTWIADYQTADYQMAGNSALDWVTQGSSSTAALSLSNLQNSSERESTTNTLGDELLGETFSTFSMGDELLSPQNSTRATHWQGSLRADTFSIDVSNALTIISGNGNVEYGDGRHDFLDLTSLSRHAVAEWSLADSGGVMFDVGNGDRIFDSLLLSNGSQVLFEGLDSVQFSDGWLDLSIDPNDPKFGEQWNLHMMGVHNAWRFTQGSADVLVGVQDTGLGYNSTTDSFHADLAKTTFIPNNVADDFFRNVPDSQYGVQDFSHGTSVQSIISATTNNGYGMSGINWNSGVVNIDVLDNNDGDLTLAKATQEMINYANQQGKKLVINMSLGGSGQIDPNFERLVANNQNNALFVIANGNDGGNRLNNPASLSNYYNNVMGIGASWGTEDYRGRPTEPGDRIDYSTYGPGISLMGPSEVIAATASPSWSDTQFDWMNKFNGTSAAAPNVAGVASLVWSIDSRFSANHVSQILKETAYDLNRQGYDYETGAGFVNADAAVRRAMALSRTLNSRSFGWGAAFDTAVSESVTSASNAKTLSIINDQTLNPELTVNEDIAVLNNPTTSFISSLQRPVTNFIKDNNYFSPILADVISETTENDADSTITASPVSVSANLESLSEPVWIETKLSQILTTDSFTVEVLSEAHLRDGSSAGNTFE